MTKTESKDGQELIQAVVADPNADAPRLAYAQWLEQQGQPDRARIIRVQCELETLHQEEKELLDQHRYEWGKALFGDGADHWKFHRGFPEEIEISAHHFLKNHAEINRLTPIRHLTLGALSDDGLAKLAALPLGRQLLSLDLGSPYGHSQDWEFGVGGIKAMTESEHLKDLKKLTLRSDRIGAAGAKLIANSPVLTNLSHLQLVDPVFDRKGHTSIRQLAVAPAMANLQFLQMGRDELESGPAGYGVMEAHTLKSIREQARNSLHP